MQVLRKLYIDIRHSHTQFGGKNGQHVWGDLSFGLSFLWFWVYTVPNLLSFLAINFC